MRICSRAMAAGTDDATDATRQVVRAYFERLERGELEAPLKAYAPHGRITIHGVLEEATRERLAEYFASLRAAAPDFALEVVDVTAEGDRAAVRWRITGTFTGPGRLQGFEPTGARLALEGLDLVVVEDGLIVRNDAYADGISLARQIGLLPAEDSGTHARMAAAFNARTRAARRLGGTAAQEIADGVWVVRGGFPLRTMNVYLVRDTKSASRSGTGTGGVLAFDAGIEAMAGAILHAAAPLGGLTRVVLGHGHVDHRGAAPRLGVPVLCHPDERADAEGDAGVHYMHLGRLRPHMRVLYAKVLFGLWDGGPVQIAGSVSEGDEVAGFRVVHLPGHAPGLIALWREADRLALASDAFYTIDPQTLRKGEPRVAHAAFNLDTEQARASMRKLAALEPATAWSGHTDPVTGDVGRQLERAAATT
jgi:glyoxylase-like metal-dependent hydrolase (beta-lactamase superfamily II)/predicted ester cyclase